MSSYIMHPRRYEALKKLALQDSPEGKTVRAMLGIPEMPPTPAFFVSQELLDDIARSRTNDD
jgi:hypothetical protein